MVLKISIKDSPLKPTEGLNGHSSTCLRLKPSEDLTIRYFHPFEFHTSVGIDARQCPALRKSARVVVVTLIGADINTKRYTALVIWLHSHSLDSGPNCVHFHYIGIVFSDHHKLKLFASHNARAVETPVVRPNSDIEISDLEISDLDPCPLFLLCRGRPPLVKRGC